MNNKYHLTYEMFLYNDTIGIKHIPTFSEVANKHYTKSIYWNIFVRIVAM